MLVDVVSVQAECDFTLDLTFETGERRRFDMAPWMDRPPWARLKGLGVFRAAFVENGTVAWPGGIDIDPEALYARSVPVEDRATA